MSQSRITTQLEPLVGDTRRTMIWVLLPLGALGTAAVYRWSDAYGAALSPAQTAILAATTVLSLYTFALILYIFHLDRVRRVLTRRLSRTQDRLGDVVAEGTHLRARMDFLSAMKNVTSVLCHDVSFHKVLDGTLQIVGDLLGHGEEEEIAVFLLDRETGRLEPRAMRQGGRTLFDKDLKRKGLDLSGLTECVEHRQPSRIMDGEFYAVALPLVVDREAIGAVRLRVRLGEDPEVVRRVDDMERDLEEVLGALALAIKTPDLYTRTIQDGLTGLFSKRHFLNQLEEQVAAATRHKDPLSLVMIDIDHFKSINDGHGHVSGDIVLRDVAATLRGVIRAYSTAYRYGGEEMAVLVPRATAGSAQEVAERIRRKVASRRFRTEKGRTLHVTISVGVATWDPALSRAMDLVVRADEALYHAKRNGRDQVVTWSPEIQSAVA